MVESRHIPSVVYKLMLLAATIIWGASFVAMKNAVEAMGPAQLVGIRFLIAGIILGLVFRRQFRSMLTPGGLRAGAIMGGILFLAFWLQTFGLTDTTPGKNAFLTAPYCVMVPFMNWAITRVFPGMARIVAALLCVIGIGLVSLQPGSLTIGLGDALTLACAVVFAIEIVCISRFTKTYDAIGITVVQFLVCGILGLIAGALGEPAPTLSAITPEFLAQMAYLILLSSCACYVFQNVGLAHVDSAQGALILSLESVFGVLSSMLLYGETLTPSMVVGFFLIFVAILISELVPDKQRLDAPQATPASGSASKAMPQEHPHPSKRPCPRLPKESEDMASGCLPEGLGRN